MAMTARSIVEHLDVAEDVGPRQISRASARCSLFGAMIEGRPAIGRMLRCQMAKRCR